MSFLSIFALFGLGLATLPILAHLRRQRLKEQQSFSSLMFLKPTKIAKKQSSKLEQLLLLCMRLLALICLVLAFARPVWLGDLMIKDGLEKRMLTILIDTSASMHREAVQSEFQKQLNLISESISPTDHLEIISFNQNAKVLLSYDKWHQSPQSSRKSLLEAQLKEVSFGESIGKLNQAVLFAEQRQSQTWNQFNDFEKLAQREIIVLSDLSIQQELEGLEQIKEQGDLAIHFINLHPIDANNARPSFIEPTQIDRAPKLALEYLHGQSTKSFQLELLSGEQSLWTQHLQLDPGNKAELEWPKQVSFQTDKAYRLQLKGDDESFDNTQYYVARQKDHLHLIHFTPKQSTISTDNCFFLEQGLKSDHVLKVSYHDQMKEELEQGKSFFIVERVLTKIELDALKMALEKGARALFILNSNEQEQNLSSLMTQKVRLKSHQHPLGLGLKKVDTKHPLFQKFSDPHFRDFSALHFWHSYELQLNEKDTITQLASFDNKKAFLSEAEIGEGKLWIMHSSWSSKDSNFARSSKFLPFLFSLVRESGARVEFKSDYYVGQKTSFEITDESNFKVVLPSALSQNVESQQKETSHTGIYEIVYQGTKHRYHVNLPLEESNTRGMSQINLDYLNSFHHPEASSKKLSEQQKKETQFLKQLELEQQLWKAFLIAAMIFIAIETIMAATKSKLTTESV